MDPQKFSEEFTGGLEWLASFDVAEIEPLIRESDEWRKISAASAPFIAALGKTAGPGCFDGIVGLIQRIYAAGYARGKREATELDPKIWKIGE